MSDLSWLFRTYDETVIKAMRVNSKTGEYLLLKTPEDEEFLHIPNVGNIEMYAKTIAQSGLIFLYDIDEYLYQFSPVNLRRFIRSGKNHMVYSFRRKVDKNYIWMTFEIMIPADYAKDNPYVLYTWRVADNESCNMADAMNMLSNDYLKIIKINISDDTHSEIKIPDEEMKTDHGLSVKISEWFRKFAEAGNVYEKDLESYYEFVSLHHLRMHFKHSGEPLKLIYRRRFAEDYRWVSMEVIRSVEYFPDNQVLIIYIREINDTYELIKHRENGDLYDPNHDIMTGIYNRIAYNSLCNKYREGKKSAVVAVYIDINALQKVNDTRGNAEGDKLLIEYAAFLEEYFGQCCYRIDGDVFVVLILNQNIDDIMQLLVDFKQINLSEKNQVAAIGYAWEKEPSCIENVVKEAKKSMLIDKHEYYRYHAKI